MYAIVLDSLMECPIEYTHEILSTALGMSTKNPKSEINKVRWMDAPLRILRIIDLVARHGI